MFSNRFICVFSGDTPWNLGKGHFVLAYVRRLREDPDLDVFLLDQVLEVGAVLERLLNVLREVGGLLNLLELTHVHAARRVAGVPLAARELLALRNLPGAVRLEREVALAVLVLARVELRENDGLGAALDLDLFVVLAFNDRDLRRVVRIADRLVERGVVAADRLVAELLERPVLQLPLLHDLLLYLVPVLVLNILQHVRGVLLHDLVAWGEGGSVGWLVSGK